MPAYAMDLSLPSLMRAIFPDLRFPPRLSPGVLAGVILVHAGILALVLSIPETAQPVTPAAPLYVRLIESSVTPPEAPPIQPKPVAPHPAKTQPVPPPPIQAVRPRPAPEMHRPDLDETPRIESRRAEAARPDPQPVPTPVPVEAPQPVTPLPVVPPRFNADYLDNPKPPYPSLSQRMEEAGEVKLRVLVDANGNVQQIGIHRSSGYPRLDQSALETVKQHWRFTPARQGDQPVSSWVIVPIQFKAP